MEKFPEAKEDKNIIVHVSKGFTCPICGAFSAHNWWNKFHFNLSDFEEINVINSVCQSCNNEALWIKRNRIIGSTIIFDRDTQEDFEKLVYPFLSEGTPQANPDMPDSVKKFYNEASLVLSNSPRASAALSRLALENLVDYLGATGKDLNLKIKDLVSKGLPATVQQALDSVRFIGNKAVHPGEIQFDDNKEIALTLLHFINIIIDNQITQPNKINNIYTTYIPEAARKRIEERDSK